MSLLSPIGFVRLLKEVKPKKVILIDTPQLYSALKSEASNVSSVILSFEALKEKDFLQPFLKNYLQGNTNKTLGIKFELSDLESIDENLIAEFNQKGLKTFFKSPEVDFFNDSIFNIILHDCETNRILSKDSIHLQEISRFTHYLSKKISISYPTFNVSDQSTSPLDSIIHHFSHLKEYCLKLSFNEKMVKNRRNFEILTQCTNLVLLLSGDEKLLPNTPALDLFQNLPYLISFSNKEWFTHFNLETYIEKIKELKSLFPNQYPLDLIAAGQLRTRFTDEILLQLKPEKSRNRSKILLMGLPQITIDGVLKYLEGLHFTHLNLTGCKKVISEGGLQKLQELYPHVKIVLE